MSVKIRQKKGFFYLDIYYRGSRTWEATGLSVPADPAQAKETLRLVEAMRAKREREVISGAWGLLDPGKATISLVAYAEEVAGTKGEDAHLLKALPYLKRYAGQIQVRAVDPDWLEGFKAFLLAQKNLKQVTAAHYYADVVHVFHRAVRAKIILSSPTDGVVGIPIPEPMKPHLTREEEARLAAHPLPGDLGYEIYRGFLFACRVGLRVSDVQRLTYGDIEMIHNAKTGKAEPCIVRRQKKTQDVVYVPIIETAMAIIGDLEGHAHDELIFPRLSQSQTSPTQYFRKWAAEAGVHKAVGWHMSRHTFAIRLLEEGTDIYTVSKLLGHSSIKTTMAYAKATDGMKRQAVEKLPEIALAPQPARTRKKKAP